MGMDMEMGMKLTGSFKGHVLPGVMFLVWALWWTGELIFKRDNPNEPPGPMEASLLVPLGKVVVPLIGIWVELFRSGFVWGDGRINNFQHAMMYFGFVLAGVVDLLARRGLVSNRLTYFAFAGAAANAGFLFAGHGHMGGLADTVHYLLILLFYAAAVVAIAELFLPSWGLKWVRIALVFLLGTWLIQIAYMLYAFGYDLHGHYPHMKAHLFFTWHLFGVAVLMLGLRVALGRPRRPLELKSHR